MNDGAPALNQSGYYAGSMQVRDEAAGDPPSTSPSLNVGAMSLVMAVSIIGGVAAKLFHDAYPVASAWMCLAVAGALYRLVRLIVGRAELRWARGAVIIGATAFTFFYFIVIAGESWRPGGTRDPMLRLLRGLELLIRIGVAGSAALVVSVVAGWHAVGSPRVSRTGALAPLFVGVGLSVLIFTVGMTLFMAVLAFVPGQARTFVLLALLLLGPACFHSLWTLVYASVLGRWEVDPPPDALRRGLSELQSRTAFRFDRVVCLNAGYGAGRNCEVTSSVRGATLIVSEAVIDLFEPDELLAVLAHEAAHVQLNHVRRKIVFGMAATAAWLAGYIAISTVISRYQPANLGFLQVVIPAMALAPLRDLYDKLIRRRHEREADEYAARAAGAAALLRALEKLRAGCIGPNVAHRWTTHGTWEQRSAHLASLDRTPEP
jgi:Zn-dependent protease with chaperone function